MSIVTNQHYFDVVKAIEEITEEEEGRFDELEIHVITGTTPKAARIQLKSEKYTKLRREEIEQWYPLSQLRKMDGTIYASKYILREKNIS